MTRPCIKASRASTRQQKLLVLAHLLKYPIHAAFSCHEVWHSILRSGTSARVNFD